MTARQDAHIALRLNPFLVLIDQREKLPYSFDSLPTKKSHGGRLVVPVETCYLPTGDYTIQGFEDRFALERKSLEDLYVTIGQHRDRFEAELQRLDAMDFAAVIIEADLRDVWRPASADPCWRSKLNPRAVESSIVAWSIRYPRVHWWPVGGRREGEARAFEAMEQFWRMANHVKKEATEAAST